MADISKILYNIVGDAVQVYSEIKDSGVKPVCSTGVMALDDAIGIGGWPEKRLNIMWGRESAGKSTICLQTIVDFQKKQMALPESERRWVALIEPECSFDEEYAKALGVDLDFLAFSQPSSLEESLDIMWTLIDSGKFALIVFDSLASIPSNQQIEADTGAANIASKARVLSQELPKLINHMKDHNCTVLMVNQLREKPGVMYGSPEYAPGGSAAKFAASVIVQLNGSARNDTDVTVKAKVVKNKVGKPYRVAEFLIEYGLGADNMGYLLEKAVELGILAKKGSWYYIKKKNNEEEAIGQGKEPAKEWVRTNEEKLLKRIKQIEEQQKDKSEE